MEFNYFISHSKNTKASIAIPIAQILLDTGFQVWIDRKELSSGEQIYTNIKKAIEHTCYCIAIIDKAYLEHSWTLEELQLFHDKANSDTNIIPIFIGLEKSDIYKKIPWLDGIAFEKMDLENFNLFNHLDIICRIIGRFYNDISHTTLEDSFNHVLRHDFACKETLLALINSKEYYSPDLRIAIIESCNIGGIIYAIYKSYTDYPNLIIDTLYQLSAYLRTACFDFDWELSYNMYVTIFKAITAAMEQLDTFLNSI